MGHNPVKLGEAANDGTGDPARTAFGKINDDIKALFDASVSDLQFDASTGELVLKLASGEEKRVEVPTIKVVPGPGPEPFAGQPEALGKEPAIGTSEQYARGDHIHPMPTLRDLLAAAGAPSQGAFTITLIDGEVRFTQ